MHYVFSWHHNPTDLASMSRTQRLGCLCIYIKLSLAAGQGREESGLTFLSWLGRPTPKPDSKKEQPIERQCHDNLLCRSKVHDIL